MLTEQPELTCFLYKYEPFISYTMPELSWWLLCHGISVPASLKKTSSRKVQDCSFFVSALALQMLYYRIHEAVETNAPVIDVDGSYLYRKQVNSGCSVSMLPLPACLCLAGSQSQQQICASLVLQLSYVRV